VGEIKPIAKPTNLPQLCTITLALKELENKMRATGAGIARLAQSLWGEPKKMKFAHVIMAAFGRNEGAIQLIQYQLLAYSVDHEYQSVRNALHRRLLSSITSLAILMLFISCSGSYIHSLRSLPTH
jgi:hypothetical protein